MSPGDRDLKPGLCPDGSLPPCPVNELPPPDKPTISQGCPQIPIPDPAVWQTCLQYTGNTINNFYDSVVNNITGDLTYVNSVTNETFDYLANYFTSILNETVAIFNEFNQYILTNIQNTITYYQEFIDILINTINETYNVTTTVTSQTFNVVDNSTNQVLNDYSTGYYIGGTYYATPPPPPVPPSPPAVPPKPAPACPDIKLESKTNWQYLNDVHNDTDVMAIISALESELTSDTTLSDLLPDMESLLPISFAGESRPSKPGI